MILPSGPPPEPVLSAEDQAAFARGVDEYNQGLFFECHETLEDVWHGVRGPARDFFQGLIQVSVAFYHLTNRNPPGARSLLQRGLKRLQGYGDRYGGVELERLRRDLAGWLARLNAGEAPVPSLEEIPKWERSR